VLTSVPVGPVCVGLPDAGLPAPGAGPGPPEPGDLAERCVALLMARLGATPQHNEGPAVG
ncbi:hypothetical protein AB4212_34755, partial [Streptomyces sp. 2MCAF27]